MEQNYINVILCIQILLKAFYYISRFHIGDAPCSSRENCRRLRHNSRSSGKPDQAFKVIWHKAASLPRTDRLIVFARWRQCALSPNAWFLWPTQAPASFQSVDSFCRAHWLVYSRSSFNFCGNDSSPTFLLGWISWCSILKLWKCVV